jgi:hypothetical protein
MIYIYSNENDKSSLKRIEVKIFMINQIDKSFHCHRNSCLVFHEEMEKRNILRGVLEFNIN